MAAHLGWVSQGQEGVAAALVACKIVKEMSHLETEAEVGRTLREAKYEQLALGEHGGGQALGAGLGGGCSQRGHSGRGRLPRPDGEAGWGWAHLTASGRLQPAGEEPGGRAWASRQRPPRRPLLPVLPPQ